MNRAIPCNRSVLPSDSFASILCSSLHEEAISCASRYQVGIVHWSWSRAIMVQTSFGCCPIASQLLSYSGSRSRRKRVNPAYLYCPRRLLLHGFEVLFASPARWPDYSEKDLQVWLAPPLQFAAHPHRNLLWLTPCSTRCATQHEEEMVLPMEVAALKSQYPVQPSVAGIDCHSSPGLLLDWTSA